MKIRNWKKFQHYGQRRPPWIKVYRTLLDDPDWHVLPGDVAKTLVNLWLIASDQKIDPEQLDGSLPDIDTLAFRLRLDSNMLADHIEVLLSKGFLVDDS